MFLMSLSNWDYVWITVFLALSFSIAYLQRRKNPSSDAFLTAATPFDRLLSIIGEFGLIEIILAGVAGSYLGFNAIYLMLIATLFQLFIQQLLTTCYTKAGVTDFNSYVGIKYPKIIAALVAILNIILLIICVSVVISIAFKSLQALMGYGFINNIMGLLGFGVMCALIGGRLGISYTKLFYFALIFLVFLTVIICGFSHLGGFDVLTRNLANLARAKNLPANYYLLPNLHQWPVLGFILVGFAGFRLLNFRITPAAANPALKMLGRSGIIILLILPGIIALGSTIGGGINGKKIVTVMAQSPDGQTAYIVKAVDAKEAKADTAPGIIPPLLNDKTNLLEPGKYNYNLANIVVFRHYLPKPLLVLMLIMLFAAFLLSVADYMLKLGQITLNNILIPFNLIAQYGKIGELWSLQVGIVSYTGITLALSYFLFLHYDLILFMKIITLTLIVPLLILLGLSLFLPKRMNKN